MIILLIGIDTVVFALPHRLAGAVIGAAGMLVSRSLPLCLSYDSARTGASCTPAEM